MGDRGQVKIIHWDDKEIYLYTHWGGGELEASVKKTLSKRSRWNDDSYLTRMLFCDMVEGYEKDETGFGIQTVPNDDAGITITINPENQTIEVNRGGEITFDGSFKDFIMTVVDKQ